MKFKAFKIRTFFSTVSCQKGFNNLSGSCSETITSHYGFSCSCFFGFGTSLDLTAKQQLKHFLLENPCIYHQKVKIKASKLLHPTTERTHSTWVALWLLFEKKCRHPSSVGVLTTSEHNTFASQDRYQILPSPPHCIS